MAIVSHSAISTAVRGFSSMLFGAFALLALAPLASAQEAQWIWHPDQQKGATPQGTSCYFRKEFTITRATDAQIVIAADDRYELYINGRRAGNGETALQRDRYDIVRLLGRGKNIIAVKIDNTNGNTAAFAAQVAIKEDGGGWKNFSTDNSWRTNLKPFLFWNAPLYNASAWKNSQTFGAMGKTAPWDGVSADPNACQAANANANRFLGYGHRHARAHGEQYKTGISNRRRRRTRRAGRRFQQHQVQSWSRISCREDHQR